MKLLLAASLSGILYVFSFAPWDFHFLQWVAFVPLLVAVDRLPATREGGKWTALAGLGMACWIGIGGFYWMIHATMHYGGLPFAAALVIFVAFCLTGQLQVPLYLLLRRAALGSLRERPASWLGLPLLFGTFYAGIESFTPKLFQDTAGHAFQGALWIRQVADLGGVFLLTLLSIATNELFAGAIRKKSLRPAFTGLGVILLCATYGAWTVSRHRNVLEDKESAGQPLIRIALVQANIGDLMKVAAEQGTQEAMSTVLRTYLDLSRKALEAPRSPDAIVWPETAYPSIFSKPQNLREAGMEKQFLEFLAPLSHTFIFGGYDLDSLGTEYNALFFHHPPTRSTRAYRKNVLLMFGETLPFSDLFPSMKSWFPTMGFFGRGPGPEVLEVNNKDGVSFRFAPSICYEGLLESHSAAGALLGADALLNVTNDSWFGPYGEPYLHLALTRFRTIETRLPLLRSTNTGFSVWMDALGEQRASSGLFEPAVVHAEVKKRQIPPPWFLRIAERWGPRWFPHGCQILTGLLAGLLLFRHRRNPLKVQNRVD